IRRYKPEQRMVARAHLTLVHDAEARTRELDVMVRLFGDERGARIARDVAAWRAAGAAALLPRPLGALEAGAVYVEEALSGHTLRASVRDGEVTPAVMAHALAALHAAPAVFERRQGVRERLAMLAPVLSALEGAGIAGSVEVARELAAAAPAEHAGVPIHGDLHARQVLVQDGQPRFVDFERCAMGDPLDDLGNLLAHLEWEHATMGAEGAAAGPFAEALAREYAAVTPARAPEVLGFYRACALLEIAELPVRRRTDDAVTVSAQAVAMARAALRGQG
ncbi:MAG: phosphotransferase, partial [Candidatus Eisenbacteria bacterium]